MRALFVFAFACLAIAGVGTGLTSRTTHVKSDECIEGWSRANAVLNSCNDTLEQQNAQVAKLTATLNRTSAALERSTAELRRCLNTP